MHMIILSFASVYIMKGKGFKVQLQVADRQNIDCYMYDKEKLV